MNPPTGAANLLAQKASGSKAPVVVVFQVTERCNYECAHCYQDHHEKRELSFAEIDRILGELADAGVLFLTLMGGEFFMRRDADDILRRAHELGFAIKLKTTGHHITAARADFLATVRPLQVDISLYGSSAKVHEGVTLAPGSWERSVAAARRLIERRITVELRSPVMASNLEDLGALRTLATSLGAECSFDPKVTGKQSTDPTPIELRLDDAALRAFYRDEPSGAAGHLREGFAGYDGATELRALHHTPCRAGQQTVGITPEGEVWPCNVLPVSCGNLREQSFAEIWFGSEILHDLRTLTWARISECNACDVRDFCKRCHSMALLEQGDMKGPSLEACRHAVATRDALREQGILPASHTALPPTWERVDPHGQHHLLREAHAESGRRSPLLRVLG